MKVYVLDPKRIYPQVSEYARACFVEIVALAQRDRFQRHQLGDDCHDAELIIAPVQSGACGAFFQQLRRHPLFQAYADKIVGFCPDDYIFPIIPGIYASVSSRWQPSEWITGGHYVSTHIHKHRFDQDIPEAQRDLLFSFVGSSNTHSMRKRVLKLRHPHSLLRDTSPNNGYRHWWQQAAEQQVQCYTDYRQIMQRTRFALCPRGRGPSTIRLYESLEAGCVPVIISDHLLLPCGPDWDTFSLRVPEKDIDRVPKIVESYAHRFGQMSQRARQAWEDYFSPQSTFNTLVNWGAKLLNRRHEKRDHFTPLAVLGEYSTYRNLASHLAYLVRGH